MRRLLMLLPAVVFVTVMAVPSRADETDNKEAIAADEARLKNAFQATDGESLVKFLSTRARGEATAKQLDELLAKLSAKDVTDRDKACQELVAIGTPAVPKLRLAARDPDEHDSAAMARRVLRAIDADAVNVTSAAVRLLAARRPPGTAEALLAYLPHSENETVMDEIKASLAGVAYTKGKPDPSMLKALADPHPLRRANAIVALCAGGIAEPRDTLRKLLLDKSPSVQLRAGLALAQASDPKAVSTLIALLAQLSPEQGREVESFLTDLAGEQSPKVELGTDDLSKQKASTAWAKWWLDNEGPKLLDELKKRTLTEELMAKSQGLIEKLGDDSFEIRQSAENDLRKMGGMIMPLLRQALKNPDIEIRNRSQKILTTLEMDKSTPLSPVTARLIALRKPKGAVEAILAYIPFADDESLVEELQGSLNAVAYPGGKASPALLKALADKLPIRRAVAAAALCHGPLADHMDEIRKVLKDKDESVRLRVALALAGAREPEAVPALISLVGELDPERSQTAEDYLYKLAREAPPKDLPEGDDARKKRSEVWDKWWTANKQTVAMVDRFTAEVKARHQGFVTMVQANNNQIVELDRNYKPRLTMTGLLNPWDAQWLNNNRVLVTEYNGMRVTERDLKGEIKWEKKFTFYPMQAERLKNGHTFVVGQNMLVQVDRAGREVWKLERPHDIRSARRLPNGEIVIVTGNRQLIRLDRNGKEKKTVTLPNNVHINYQNEILNNGNVLIPTQWNNQLIEFTSEGKELFRITQQQPVHAIRLPNNNMLIALGNWPNKFVETDKAGKQVREHQTNTYVFRIRAR